MNTYIIDPMWIYWINALNRIQEMLGEMSRKMEQKYEYAIPRPCCVEPPKDGGQDDA